MILKALISLAAINASCSWQIPRSFHVPGGCLGLLTCRKSSQVDLTASPHMFGHGDSSHTMSALQSITLQRYIDVEIDKERRPRSELISLLESSPPFSPPKNLKQHIIENFPAMTLAAEFKRASPSKGDIAVGIDIQDQAKKYVVGGAGVISVLTEAKHFKGSLNDMKRVRMVIDNHFAGKERICLVLRKDFIVDEYQIIEALLSGADTILLIVAVLEPTQLKNLIDFSRSKGMEPLVEVHAEAELDVALAAGAEVIGVNNRDLHTFKMDLTTTSRTARKLKDKGALYQHDSNYGRGEAGGGGVVLCSLSGMSSSSDVDENRQEGVMMCLIGESLMRAVDPVKAIVNLGLDPRKKVLLGNGKEATGAYTRGTSIIKVCGITSAAAGMHAAQSGANLIGVIFAEKSKRVVDISQAKEVVSAVRRFGERDKRAQIGWSCGEEGGLKKLTSAARVPLVVGVFQDQSADEINRISSETGIDLVQLHGQEGWEFCSKIDLPCIRVVNIESIADSEGFDADFVANNLMSKFTTEPVAILLDTSIRGVGGGAGVAFDWSIAEFIQNSGHGVIVAGGLDPSNVDIAVSKGFYGIDASSGLEVGSGNIAKDERKVEAYVRRAKEASEYYLKGF